MEEMWLANIAQSTFFKSFVLCKIFPITQVQDVLGDWDSAKTTFGLGHEI